MLKVDKLRRESRLTLIVFKLVGHLFRVHHLWVVVAAVHPRVNQSERSVMLTHCWSHRRSALAGREWIAEAQLWLIASAERVSGKAAVAQRIHMSMRKIEEACWASTAECPWDRTVQALAKWRLANTFVYDRANTHDSEVVSRQRSKRSNRARSAKSTTKGLCRN